MFNKITLIGRLGQNAEIKNSKSKNEYVIVNIATQESWKDDKGTYENGTEWHRVSRLCLEVDAPKVRYLSVEEIKRLVEFCPSEFKPMILAPIYTWDSVGRGWAGCWLVTQTRV